MNSPAVAGSVPVSLQFSIPLLILGNLTGGSQISDGLATKQPDDRIETFGLPPGYTAYPDIGVAYKYYNSAVSWHEARKRCPSEGGYLAVVDSQQKFEIIQKMRLANVVYTWTGVQNFYDPHEWCGINNGLPVSFFTWLGNYPTDIEQRHCVCLRYMNGETKYFNENCGNGAAYVCEIPIMKHCGRGSGSS